MQHYRASIGTIIHSTILIECRQQKHENQYRLACPFMSKICLLLKVPRNIKDIAYKVNCNPVHLEIVDSKCGESNASSNERRIAIS